MADSPQEDEPGGSRRGPLLALLAIVVVVVGSLWIMHRISSADAVQDCVASGRTNCAPIAAH